jgi:glycosyltransferase involved in cell wall biosynthesis
MNDSIERNFDVIIYESSSFGGCFEYSKRLHPAYQNHPKVRSSILMLPKNSRFRWSGVLNNLISDKIDSSKNWLKKLHFIYRNLFNPLLLFWFLLFRNSSIIILNDFEQLTAPIWVPLYKLFLGKHKFAVVLHDPDRDNYPPSKSYSEYCMGLMMGIMDLGLYHETLPNKKYYEKSQRTSYLSIPHGLYPKADNDDVVLSLLENLKADYTYLAILGNIREEKNYHLAIEALTLLPHYKLIIAGSPSNSSVLVDVFKQKIRQLGLEEKVIWIDKFLSDNELSSVICASDIILLNYARTFTSQSGVINLIAPYYKKFIYSNVPSGLSSIAKQFKLGLMVEPDNKDSLVQGIETINEMEVDRSAWDNYSAYASWENHVNYVLANIKV